MAHHTKFKKPPINEVALGLFHLPIIELRAQHIGIYWKRIRDCYRFCEQYPPIISTTETQPNPSSSPFHLFPGEVVPLPRFWFLSDVHATLIQIQREAFVFNWRRRAPQDDYPHFEAVEANFWRELEVYKEFLQETVGAELDVVKRCELTYVNLIDANDVFSSPADMKNILPAMGSLTDMQNDKRELVELNVTSSLKISTDLFVDYTAKFGRRVDTNKPVVVLELKAHGTPRDFRLAGTHIWYKEAHDAIYDLFLSSTHKQVQESIWEYIG